MLEYAAKYKESLLLNRYRAGRAQIARGLDSAPYAYVIPQDQRDVVAAVELLRRLAFGGVRVAQLTDSTTIDGATYPAGTWVIPTDQEFAALAREVLDVQNYPDLRQYPGGPPERPYDAAGWTLPLQMGVRLVSASTPLSADARSKMTTLGPAVDPKLRPLPYSNDRDDAAVFDSVPGTGFNSNPAAAAIVPPPGRLTGSGPALAVDPAQNNAFRAINRAWHEGATVQFAPAMESRTARYIISGLPEDRQSEMVRSLALSAERTSPAGVTVRKPRIGVYEPWGGNLSAGWTRWILEQYGFDYVTLRPGDFHEPLIGKIDVLVMPDGARLGTATTGRRGRAVRPEYDDSVSAEDLSAFETFIRAGATLVCLSSSSTFAIQQFKLPIANSVYGLRPEEFFLRGSIVSVAMDVSQPIMFQELSAHQRDVGGRVLEAKGCAMDREESLAR